MSHSAGFWWLVTARPAIYRHSCVVASWLIIALSFVLNSCFRRSPCVLLSLVPLSAFIRNYPVSWAGDLHRAKEHVTHQRQHSAATVKPQETNVL